MEIILNGALGRMGRAFSAYCEKNGVPISGKCDISAERLSDFRKSGDVLVDFSDRSAAEETAAFIVSKKIPAVLATTGYGDREKSFIKKAAESVYAEAKKRLRNLSEEDTLKLFGRLLSSYAEEGDSVVFADDFGYVDQVALLPVFLQRKLSVLKAEKAQGVHVDGGLYLVGKTADKDLTFDALLKADFEERQAEIVNALFGNG